MTGRLLDLAGGQLRAGQRDADDRVLRLGIDQGLIGTLGGLVAPQGEMQVALQGHDVALIGRKQHGCVQIFLGLDELAGCDPGEMSATAVRDRLLARQVADGPKGLPLLVGGDEEVRLGHFHAVAHDALPNPG